MHVKKGDNVIVIAGKNKGQKGTIKKVLADSGRVVVEGVNKVKKNIKPRTKDKKGTTVEIEASINASNVMIVDPKGGKRSRVGYKHVGDKKVRIAKKSGQEI